MQGDLSWPLERAAHMFGTATALIGGGCQLNYRELSRRTQSLAAAQSTALGIPRGGRFGVLAENSPAHLECWLAVPASGRVLVDLNLRLTREELAFLVDDARIKALLVDETSLDTGRLLREQCAGLDLLVLDGPSSTPTDCLAYGALLEVDPIEPDGNIDPETLAAISYTGGTTGTPKGVMLSHGNLLANARHNLQATGHRHEDRWLHVAPMFHVAGTANVFAATWVGARQVTLPRFDAAAVVDTIEAEGITHVTLVPTMLAMLLDHLDGRTADLSSLRHVQYAASPITPDLQRRVLERLNCEVHQFYGMTEASPTVSQLTGEDHRRGFAGEEPYALRLRSMGAPVPGVQVEIRDADRRRLGPGEIGEVWVRGPNMMLGYWNRQQATESALVDGWYRTGDAAYVDEAGYLFMVDRLKDMIISGGENVYSVEVEAALSEHPAVYEAAVFGVPDPRWGEAVHAIVVTAQPLESAELEAHCRNLIAGFKVPRSFDLRDSPLPRSGAGKVLKNELRDAHWGDQQRRVG